AETLLRRAGFIGECAEGRDSDRRSRRSRGGAGAEERAAGGLDVHGRVRLSNPPAAGSNRRDGPLMNIEQILQLLDNERPRFAGYGRLVERLEDVTRFHGVDGSHRVVVIAAGFDARNVDAVIAREIEHHRALGDLPFEWTM